MLDIRSTLKARNVMKIPYQGFIFHVKPIVAIDMICQHRAFLGAVMPPNAADIMLRQQAGLAESAEERRVIETQALSHLLRVSQDPDLMRRSEDFNLACVMQAVVGIQAEGEDDVQRVRLILPPENDTADLTPQAGGVVEVGVDLLPAGTISHLAQIIRQTSFGGEGAAERIASFRK